MLCNAGYRAFGRGNFVVLYSWGLRQGSLLQYLSMARKDKGLLVMGSS